MSANRILILLVVVAAVLYAVILALGSRNQGNPVDPEASWLKKLAPSQAFDPDEVVPTNGWENGRWTISKGVQEAHLEIEPSRDGQVIRRVKVSLKGGGSFDLEFQPRKEKGESGKYMDAEATELNVEDVTPERDPVELTILEHGGVLIARRKDGGETAVFSLE